MTNYKRYVQINLDYQAGLEQLAEEAVEVAHAALKLIRALELTANFTPITEAEKKLIEELGDVLMVCEALEIDPPNIENSPKWEPWAKRLGAE